MTVQHVDIPNVAKSAISKDGIRFDKQPHRIRSTPFLHSDLWSPWNANADAISQLQETVVELTQLVWELESRVRAQG